MAPLPLLPVELEEEDADLLRSFGVDCAQIVQYLPAQVDAPLQDGDQLILGKSSAAASTLAHAVKQAQMALHLERERKGRDYVFSMPKARCSLRQLGLMHESSACEIPWESHIFSFRPFSP